MTIPFFYGMGWIPDLREGIQENIRSQSLRLESGEKHTISNNHPVCMARNHIEGFYDKSSI
jgi:hypothetical protein